MSHRRFVLWMLVLLAMSAIGLSACSKNDESPVSPAAPPPPANTATFTPTVEIPTSTPTNTPTFTNTFTRTPTSTSTPTATIGTWCPGSGESGISDHNAGIGSDPNYTIASRIQLNAAVSVTSIKVWGQSTGLVQAVGLYSDGGSGNEPGSLIQQATYTDNVSGWITVDIPDAWVGPGYFWLAVAATTLNNYSVGGCYLCGAVASFGNGVMPATWSTNLNNHTTAPNVIAVWTCP